RQYCGRTFAGFRYRIGGLLPQITQNCIEAPPGDVLHRIKVNGVLHTNAIHRNDVGVVQASRSPGLAAEALKVSWPQQGDRRQNLQSDLPTEFDLLGFVHDAHATAADLAKE